MFVSFDDGDEWQSLQMNLPPVSVRDIAIHDGDVVLATHGRGFWVLDDLAPIRRMSAETRRGAHLFQPADAVETPPPSEDGTPLPRDEPFAENRPYGAFIDYSLASPASGLAIEVVDGDGKVVRHWASTDAVVPVNPDALNIPASWVHPQEPPSAAAGLHRWIWDLRHEAPPGGRGRGGAVGFARGGALVAPGTYTVKLTVEGQVLTGPLKVLADPRAEKR